MHDQPNHKPERGLTLIKPFDEPLVIAGQGTLRAGNCRSGRKSACHGRRCAYPLWRRWPDIGHRACFCGRSTRAAARAPVEPTDFDDVARSLASGQIERNERRTGSLCDAITTPSPGVLTFPIMQEHCGCGIVVPEDDCLRAVAAAFSRLKIVAEPGGAIALAAALYHGEQIKGDTVIAVVSGGNVDAGDFESALQHHGKSA